MKRKLVTLLLALATCFGVVGLTACESEPPHSHDYALAKYDENEHWLECSCGAKEEVETHTFDVAKKDESEHWNECSCGAKQGVAAHVYDVAKKDENEHWNECACGAKQGVSTHAYDTANKDENEHWNECFCGAKQGVSAHAYDIVNKDENEHWNECVCGVRKNAVSHNYYTLNRDNEYHWDECVCGARRGQTAHNWNAQNKCVSCDMVKSTEGLEYWLYEDEGYYAVKGMGEATETDIVIGNYYNGLPIKKVEYLANASNVTSVTIADGVEAIGHGAFNGDTNLQRVALPESIRTIDGLAFADCYGLTSITIPEGVQSIGAYAFRDCYNVMNVTLPTTLVEVGEYAFGGIFEMKIYIKDVDSWCGIDFADKYAVPQGTLYVNNALPTELVIPESITEIKPYAFYGMRMNLTKLTIPGNVQTIGNEAFFGVQIETLLLGDGVQTIKTKAFNGLGDSITIPSSVKTIEEDAFSDGGGRSVYITDIAAWCTIDFGNAHSNPLYTQYNQSAVLYVNGAELTELTVPVSVTEVKAYAFYNCDTLTSVMLGDGRQSIGAYAFYGCNNLQTLTMGVGERDIGDYAFYGCPFTSVTLGDGLQRIGDYAFYGCQAYKISLPSSVRTIGAYAFYGNFKLEWIVIPASTVQIGQQVFGACIKLRGVEFENMYGWKAGDTAILADDLYSSSTVLNYLTNVYADFTWTRSDE